MYFVKLKACKSRALSTCPHRLTSSSLQSLSVHTSADPRLLPLLLQWRPLTRRPSSIYLLPNQGFWSLCSINSPVHEDPQLDETCSPNLPHLQFSNLPFFHPFILQELYKNVGLHL